MADSAKELQLRELKDASSELNTLINETVKAEIANRITISPESV